MKLLVLLAVISTCVADSEVAESSYAFPPPTNHLELQSRPSVKFSRPKPRSIFEFRRPSFKTAKSSSFFPPEEFFSLPTKGPSSSSSIFSFPENTYSAPSVLYVAPELSYSAPKAKYSAPRSTYSTPKSTYSAPKSTYLAPKSSYSAPKSTYSAPQNTLYAKPVVPILRDDRRHPDAGAYSFALETGDGTKRQESGTPVYSKDGLITAIKGSYSFTLPDGQVFEMRYIADENGFQPQSSFIPVAPAFPHPIPAHALEQIERGRREHEARARGDLLKQLSKSYSVPSGSSGLSSSYSAPY